MKPGEFLTPDECMSSWLGQEGLYSVEGIPHLSKIIRKPKGVGCEMKSVADSASKIMLRLEIMEGKERMAVRRYALRTNANIHPAAPNIDQYNADVLANDVYKATTAQTLRLLEPWFGTGRTAVGDSYFASVETLLALAKHGMYFMGIVKTAHKEYPMQHLKNWYNTGNAANPPLVRGSHKVLLSTYAGPDGSNHTMMACGWAERKNLKTIVSNRGTTDQGTPSIRARHRVAQTAENTLYTERYNISVPRPKVIEMLFDSFAAVDIADHLRQGSLTMESSWLTKKWPIRMFATILGMIFTDCYLGHVMEYKVHHHGVSTGMPTYHSFLDRLAYQLIHNPYSAQPMMIRPRVNDDEFEEVML